MDGIREIRTDFRVDYQGVNTIDSSVIGNRNLTTACFMLRDYTSSSGPGELGLKDAFSHLFMQPPLIDPPNSLCHLMRKDPHFKGPTNLCSG